MIDDLEKHRRMRALELARRQEDADRARMRREGVPAQTVELTDEERAQHPNILPPSGK